MWINLEDDQKLADHACKAVLTWNISEEAASKGIHVLR